MVDAVRDRVQEKKRLQLNGKLFCLYCCADIFRSMVEVAFEQIERIIDDIRLIVFWGKSLPLWHITLHNLQEALELESKGEYFKKDDYEGFRIPSSKEWKKVRGVCKLVGSIYDAAEVLFETKRPTASLYLHNLQELRASLKKESTSSYKFVRVLAGYMLKKFENYWADMFLVIAVATVMDPRCKMKYIEFSSLKYQGSTGNSQIKLVLEAIHSLYDDYMARNLETKSPMSDSSSSESDSEEALPRHIEERRRNRNFGFNCLDEYNQFLQSNSQPSKSELELYLEGPILPWRQDFNLLSWWRAERPKYPTLSKLARDFLTVPLSVVTSFDAYYYTDFRKADKDIVCLEPDLMNALMCTRSWFDNH